ncbi:MAG TPA: hypothetical protein VKA46_11475 [Gemmataceae bacterium]|nr:hypothetical protein [Gemmataceae bacterium]
MFSQLSRLLAPRSGKRRPHALPGVKLRVELLENRCLPAASLVGQFGGLMANAHPGQVAAGPDGTIYFIEAGANAIGKMSKAGVLLGEFTMPTQHSFATEYTPTGFPYFTDAVQTGIAVGPDGYLYVAESSSTVEKLARLKASDFSGFTESAVLGPLQGQTVPFNLTIGNDGNVYFTYFDSGQIGYLPLGFAAGATPVFSAVNPNAGAGSNPIYIRPANDGNLYFDEKGGKIGYIHEGFAAGTSVTESAPSSLAAAIVRGLTPASDGNIWFVDPPNNTVGNIAQGFPSGTALQEFLLTSPMANPFNIVQGPDGNLYVTEPSVNKIAVVNLSGRVVQEIALGAGTLPAGITVSPDGSIWVSEFGTNKIAKIVSPTTSTAFVNGTLTIMVTAGDQVNITENAPTNYSVSDLTNIAVGGSGGGPFANVKSITVNVSASGALIEVVGIDAAESTGLSGNFTVTDTQPNNALSVEVHDGFTVAGAVSISNTGAGSKFMDHISPTNGTQQVTGVFLDPNRKGSYGSVSVSGCGHVGVDGIKVFGNVSVSLGSNSRSSFVADAEWVYRQDPDSPPWTTFRQDPTVIGGNLTVTGGTDVEVYSSVVAGNTSIAEAGSTANAGGYVLLGGTSIGGALSVSTPNGTSGIFVDFATVGGNTSLTEGHGKNVIGLQADTFSGKTTLSQGSGLDYLFIDSEAALVTAAGALPGGLPNDFQYTAILSQFSLLPVDSGTTFHGTVTATQDSGVHQLEIGQDTSPITIFAGAASFTAGAGATFDESVNAFGLPPTITGY